MNFQDLFARSTNFQDLFARYREMGAMAPKKSLDELLYMRNQNVAPDSQGFFDDSLNPTRDFQSLDDREVNRKEHIIFKLPSLKSFKPLLMRMDEEHDQGISGDEEVEDLLKSPPPQQVWNLGLLKTNSLCKDYYKLTSNMIHTLIMGIKEFADGEISPAWQVAQDRAHQKESSFSNIFLQDAAGKSIETTPPTSHVYDSSLEVKIQSGSHMKHVAEDVNGVQTHVHKKEAEKIKDIDGISELRKLLWRQIVPYTYPGATLDPKQEGENKMKVAQEARMKVLNSAGFVVNRENCNSASPETCQANFELPQQELNAKDVESDLEAQTSPTTVNNSHNVPLKPSRIVAQESSSVGSIEDNVEQHQDASQSSTSHEDAKPAKPAKTKYYVSFEDEEDADVQLEQEEVYLKEVKEKRPLKRSHPRVEKETRFGKSQSYLCRRNYPSDNRSRSSIDYQPMFDDEFEIVEEEIESPPQSLKASLLGLRSSKNDAIANDEVVGKHLQIVRMNDGNIKQHSLSQYKKIVVPQRPAIRSWYVVGGFSTRSQHSLRNTHNNHPRPTKYHV